VPAIENLLAKANERGDLRATQQREDAARRREQAAGRGWVPLPTLMAGAMTANMGDQTGTGYVAGVSLSIPIFDRGQGDRARAAADRHLAIAEGRWLLRQIPSAFQTAHVLRASEAAFKEGNASVVELLDAHRTARTVRLRELELRHQVARDKRELELAVGQRL
jgi:outer membrane protein, heavy metal efflux system